MKARNLIHARIEENIRAKICRLRAGEADRSCKDALQLLIEHSWERGERLDMQVSGSFKVCVCGGVGLWNWVPGFQSAVLGGPQSAAWGPASQSGHPAQTPATASPRVDTRSVEPPNRLPLK